jgi:hypothetical protein
LGSREAKDSSKRRTRCSSQRPGRLTCNVTVRSRIATDVLPTNTWDCDRLRHLEGAALARSAVVMGYL